MRLFRKAPVAPRCAKCARLAVYRARMFEDQAWVCGGSCVDGYERRWGQVFLAPVGTLRKEW